MKRIQSCNGISTAIELFSAGRHDEARGQVEQLLQAQPDNPLALNLAGACARQLGDAEGAQRGWQRAIAARPGFADPHYNLGVLYGELGRSAEAEAAYRRRPGNRAGQARYLE